MDQNRDSTTILSIAPSPLIPPESKGQKHSYGLLDAMGNLTKVICITNIKSHTAGHSFELRPLFERKIRKFIAFANYRLIVRIISRTKPKAILLEQPYYGIILRLISKQTQTPYSIHAHQVEFLKHKALGHWWWPLVYWLERKAFQSAENIFFISGNDKKLAMRKFRLNPEKCFISPYGVPQKQPIIAPKEKVERIRLKNNVENGETLFVFFGDLKYLQNVEAVENIIREINPRVAALCNERKYKIMIAGGGASESFAKQMADLRDENIIYVGYVHDIDDYLQAADVMINPLKHRGGIRIKVIEALGFNTPVVSTEVGAIGIKKSVCGNMLKVVKNNDWDNFAKNMCELSENSDQIPQSFFDNYNWTSIAKSTLKTLSQE